jgi:hypothetical protein
MPPKKALTLGLHCSHWTSTKKHYAKLEAKRGRLQVQPLRRRNWTKKSGTLKQSISRSKGRRRRCFVFLIYRRRSMRLLRKCVISLKMTRTEDLNAENFVRTIPTMMMNGMIISIMEILFLMMLLLCQQNCRLPHGPHHTSHPAPHVWWAFRSEAVSDEL